MWGSSHFLKLLVTSTLAMNLAIKLDEALVEERLVLVICHHSALTASRRSRVRSTKTLRRTSISRIIITQETQ